MMAELSVKAQSFIFHTKTWMLECKWAARMLDW